MEQHPVPQHIGSFEFKLFGPLTIRQFVTLAIPMGIAAVVFFSRAPAAIRVALAAAIGGFGLFAALVPIGGRPFDKWFVAFIRAITAPTQRLWVKESRIPEFLEVVTALPRKEERIPESISAKGRERMRAYLRSLPRGKISPLDIKEQLSLDRLGLNLLPGEQWPEGSTQFTEVREAKLPPVIIWPTISVQPVSVSSQPVAGAVVGHAVEPISVFVPISPIVEHKQAPKISHFAKPFALTGLERKLVANMAEGVARPVVKTRLASEANFTIENVIPIQTSGNQIKLIHGIAKSRSRKLHFAPPTGFDLSKLPIRGERRFEVSEELKRRFAQDEDVTLMSTRELFEQQAPVQKPTPVVIMPRNGRRNLTDHEKIDFASASTAQHGQITKSNVVPQVQLKPIVRANVELKPKEKEIKDQKVAITDQKAGLAAATEANLKRARMVPLTNTPNVISGIVVTPTDETVENVILIIRDANGIPVRALKTNKLGQFLSATPLATGSYSMEIESDTHKFKPFTFQLEGTVMEPLEIKSES